MVLALNRRFIYLDELGGKLQREVCKTIDFFFFLRMLGSINLGTNVFRTLMCNVGKP